MKFDILLLLSKEAMKKAKAKIDFQEDKINIFGKKVKIYFTSTSNYCLELKSKLSDENVFKSNIAFLCSNVQNLSNTEKYKVALKLQIRISHSHIERLISLLQDCEINNKELQSYITYLDKRCEICIKYKKSEPRNRGQYFVFLLQKPLMR